MGLDTATLNATVNPEVTPVTDCHFEYVDDADFQVDGFAGAQTIPCDSDPAPAPRPSRSRAEITGLTPGATYHFRIVATAGETSTGQERSFTTTPIAITSPATGTDHHTNATLNGHIDPSGDTVTDCYFDWGTDTSYGNTADCVEGDDFEAAADVSAFVNGLTPGQTVHFRLHLNTTGHGEVVGADASFTPPSGQSPTLTLQGPSALTGTTATLGALVDPEGLAITVCQFEYASEAQFQTDQFASASTVPCDPDPGSGSGSVAVQAELSGLDPGIQYHFRITAENSAGSSTTPAQTFTAKGPRILETHVSGVSDTAATLNATVNPAGVLTTYHFEYGPTSAYGSSTENVSIGGISDRKAKAEIGGLAPATTYHFRIVAGNEDATSFGADTTFTTAGNTDSCPNAALRQGVGFSLPDCRAYEQATPADKQGGNAQRALTVTQAASSGDRITFADPGGLPGPGGASTPPIYVASRGADGWSSANLLPASAAGFSAGITGWSEDLGGSLAFAFTGGGSRDLYLRDTVTGVQQKLVTASSPTTDFDWLAAFAADPSHALVESPATYAPGGIAGGANLYEVEDGVVTLADRIPAGDATHCDDVGGPACIPAPQGAFAGPYQWTEGNLDVGGARKTFYTQNTLSRDGSRVTFTTKGDGRLYIRENGRETTLVSASQRSTADPNGTGRPAAWLGSTPSGSHTFFTSTEALTDDATPIPTWGIGRANLDGSSPAQSFVPANAVAVAVDSAHVYWADPTGHRIGRANLDGTGVEPSFIAGLNNPQSVAVDGSFLYWGDDGNGKHAGGTIGRANLDGSSADTDFITGVSAPHGLAVNATHVYWIDGQIFDPLGDDGGFIGRANLDGTGVNPEFITGPEIVQSTQARGLAVDADHIYWNQVSNGNIGRANLDGSGAKFSWLHVLGGGEFTGGIAVDGEHVYWGINGGVARAEIDGSSPEFKFVPATDVQGIAVDAGHVYWANHLRDAHGDLYSYDADSGDLTDLTADPAAGPRGADVVGFLGASEDGSIAYFAANGVLAPGGAPGNCRAGGSACDVYVSDHGQIRKVTRMEDGTDNWLPAYVTSAGLSRTSRVSANGTLLLTSDEPLTGYDNLETDGLDCSEAQPGSGTNRCREIYRYDPAADQLSCVSCRPDGLRPAGDATLVSEGEAFGAQPAYTFLTRNVSADGNRVFFETSDSLVAGDVNGGAACPSIVLPNGSLSHQGCIDVYEWEADGTGTCNSSAQNGGCLYLLSSGTGSEKRKDDSYYGDSSVSGDDVFIFTSHQLVSQDQDQLVDAYDVRVAGGLASQHQPPPPPCDVNAGACERAGTSPPGQPGAGTGAIQGQGDPHPRRCPANKVRRGGRCVRKHKHHKRKHHQRRTHGKRGTGK